MSRKRKRTDTSEESVEDSGQRENILALPSSNRPFRSNNLASDILDESNSSDNGNDALHNNSVGSPNSNGHRLQSSDTQPREVGVPVSRQLSDPYDLQNLINSSTPYREVLSGEKLRLSPEDYKPFDEMVFKGGEELNGEYEKEDQITPIPEIENYQHITHHPVANYPEFLQLVQKLRLEFPWWRNFFDNFYEYYWNDISSGNRELPFYWMYSSRPFAQTNFWTDPSNENQLTKFIGQLDQMKSKGQANPFFGRNVTFTLTYTASRYIYEDYIKKFQKLLKLYGGHIRYFTFAAFRDIADTWGYTVFWDMLKQMPNLKRLHVIWRSKTFREETEEDKEELVDEISANPLPTLDILETLVISKVHHLVFYELLRSNGHVSAITADQAFFHSNARPEEIISSGYVISSAKHPNLRALTLNVNTLSEHQSFFNGVPIWPLTKLCIDFDKCEFIEWSTIFHFLKKNWKDSLTHLDLTLPKAKTLKDKSKIYNNVGSLQLNFPALECAKLELKNNASLDFLLPLKTSLTVLTINASVHKNKEDLPVGVEALNDDNSDIKFWSHLDRLQDSNIWELFPKLDELSYIVTAAPMWRDEPKNMYHNKLSRRELMDYHRPTQTSMALAEALPREVHPTRSD